MRSMVRLSSRICWVISLLVPRWKEGVLVSWTVEVGTGAVGAVSGMDVRSTWVACVGWLSVCLWGGSPRSGEYVVDGDVDAESVGGVVVGSDWASCGTDSFRGAVD